jgi:hypothetical protein
MDVSPLRNLNSNASLPSIMSPISTIYTDGLNQSRSSINIRSFKGNQDYGAAFQKLMMQKKRVHQSVMKDKNRNLQNLDYSI